MATINREIAHARDIAAGSSVFFGGVAFAVLFLFLSANVGTVTFERRRDQHRPQTHPAPRKFPAMADINSRGK